ncbi:MAG TPA: hypothetical protein VFQ53_32355 [Kofleriaceae bacterium]|nr:hypothetical protein [Kofleriaceae bacterium]
MRAAAVAMLLLSTAATAQAGDRGTIRGSVVVHRARDVPAGPVLVYVVGFAEKPAATTVEIKQVGRRFLPDLVAVTAGGSVTFPNGDPFLHNVFSPTADRSFDLGSYRQGETRTRVFPKPGVLDVYCNIHPEMSATIVILPNTRFAIADASGHFELADVPAGTWSVFAYSRRAVKPTTVRVTVEPGKPAEATLELDEVQRDFTHKNKYGEKYRETVIYAPGS